MDLGKLTAMIWGLLKEGQPPAQQLMNSPSTAQDIPSRNKEEYRYQQCFYPYQ
ncbi:hypothetical protein [Paenibacillus aquistagni]|uniref:hypothetical protein n=1 Tax=Paenibacillus aquistagni TaxID=1852522 RepID=UPI00145AFA6C|nr:hypothetical protein [Paenibacillus aquistagni]NMM54779.1 hypothetical protein [Paenibacillus aquistagni]